MKTKFDRFRNQFEKKNEIIIRELERMEDFFIKIHGDFLVYEIDPFSGYSGQVKETSKSILIRDIVDSIQLLKKSILREHEHFLEETLKELEVKE